ncbi:MAG: NAD(P)H-hydrate epimerase [Advenella sp.]
MMKIYTSAQMREREQAAVDAGSSFEQLMENAGTAAASDILQHFPVPGRCLVVCGKGNNGGDGLNQMPGMRIALDMPTGLNCDTGQADENTFMADMTYTFAAYKPAHLMAHAKAYCGKIVCLDIGID